MLLFRGTLHAQRSVGNRVQSRLGDFDTTLFALAVGAFLDAASEAIEQIKNRNRKIIAVGGTALYIKSLLYGLFEEAGSDERIRTELLARAETEGLGKLHRELMSIDPKASDRINPNDARRIIRALEVYAITGKPISSFQKQWETRQPRHNWTIIGLRREKTDASGRINKRVKRMIDTGLVDEVRALLNEEKPLSKQARCAIGYAEINEHLNGRMDLKDAIEQIKINTRRLAKSQRTWFKTFSNVHWLDIEPDEPSERILERTATLLAHIGERNFR